MVGCELMLGCGGHKLVRITTRSGLEIGGFKIIRKEHVPCHKEHVSGHEESQGHQFLQSGVPLCGSLVSGQNIFVTCTFLSTCALRTCHVIQGITTHKMVMKINSRRAGVIRNSNTGQRGYGPACCAIHRRQLYACRAYISPCDCTNNGCPRGQCNHEAKDVSTGEDSTYCIFSGPCLLARF